MSQTFPNCPTHNQRVNYVCLEEKCADSHIFNCGDCLFDFHQGHIAKVDKIQNLINQLNQNYETLMNQQSSQSEDQVKKSQVVDFYNEYSQNCKIQFAKQYDEFQSDLNQQIDNSIIENQQNQEDLIEYEQLISYFERPQFEFNEEFKKNVLQIDEKIQKIKQQQENRDQVLNKFNQNQKKIEKLFQDFDEKVTASINKLQKLQKVTIKDLSSDKGGLQLWDYTFNSSKSHGMTIENNGNKLVMTGGCSVEKYIISNETLPLHCQSYWEIKKTHTNGCYDSAGLCTKYIQRNGTTANGWAVRLYGSHSDLSFTGSIHNNQSKKFYNSWESNDRIGMLYDPDLKTLTYFVNGKKIGTPFENVDGELYFLVEGCHLGGYEKVINPELPDLEQINSPNPNYN